jgi:hypothetical protein
MTYISVFQSIRTAPIQIPKFMHYSPASTLIHTSTESTRGHSAAVGDTAQEGRARTGGYADQYLRGSIVTGKWANGARPSSGSDSIRGT